VRVLYWTQLFWPHIGGIEVASASFLPAMRDRGHEFEVVTGHSDLDLPDEADWNGFPVHRFPFRSALENRDLEAIAALTRRLAELKRRFGPDLVHLRFSDPSILFHLRTRDVTPSRLLASVTVAPPPGGGGAATLLGSLLGQSDWVVAHTQAILDDVLRIEPAVADRSSVVHEALATLAAEPSPLPQDPPVVLAYGRITPDKGFDLLIAAFAFVHAELPRARLVVAGDGDARAALEAQARELGLNGAVELPGWVPPERVPTMINEATVVAMPSRWREAFGLVALEAATMARPVVATRTGGLEEVVADRKTGLLVPGEDPAALADALLELLNDPERATLLGQAGRARAQRSFSLDAQLDAYQRIYERLAP
jgi:glycosyltransferase involved in cell wall biosynthesis